MKTVESEQLDSIQPISDAQAHLLSFADCADRVRNVLIIEAFVLYLHVMDTQWMRALTIAMVFSVVAGGVAVALHVRVVHVLPVGTLLAAVGSVVPHVVLWIDPAKNIMFYTASLAMAPLFHAYVASSRSLAWIAVPGVVGVVDAVLAVVYKDLAFVSMGLSAMFTTVVALYSAPRMTTVRKSMVKLAHETTVLTSIVQQEEARIGALLGALLPPLIAKSLVEDPTNALAEYFEDAAVIFIDVRGLYGTRKFGYDMPKLVGVMDVIFGEFDHLALKHGVEKIKTINETYMAVSGLPARDPNHLEHMSQFAFDVVRMMPILRQHLGVNVDAKIGMHSGPLVAGVIGKTQFAYDVWGDTVNTASRMKLCSNRGAIVVTDHVRQLLGRKYIFSDMGLVDVKGKGRMQIHQMQSPLCPTPITMNLQDATDPSKIFLRTEALSDELLMQSERSILLRALAAGSNEDEFVDLEDEMLSSPVLTLSNCESTVVPALDLTTAATDLFVSGGDVSIEAWSWDDSKESGIEEWREGHAFRMTKMHPAWLSFNLTQVEEEFDRSRDHPPKVEFAWIGAVPLWIVVGVLMWGNPGDVGRYALFLPSLAGVMLAVIVALTAALLLNRDTGTASVVAVWGSVFVTQALRLYGLFVLPSSCSSEGIGDFVFLPETLSILCVLHFAISGKFRMKALASLGVIMMESINVCVAVVVRCNNANELWPILLVGIQCAFGLLFARDQEFRGRLVFLFKRGGIIFQLQRDGATVRQRSDALATSIFPPKVLEKLKQGVPLCELSEQVECIGVLHADIVGFTAISSGLSPIHVVFLLNDIFSAFDEMVEFYDLLKVKTIGDAYLVAGNVHHRQGDYAQRLCFLSVDMIDFVARYSATSEHEIKIRIGIESGGPGVSGVIGQDGRLFPEVWGIVVSLAMEIEAEGQAGYVHISKGVQAQISEDDFFMEKSGNYDGEETYLVSGVKRMIGPVFPVVLQRPLGIPLLTSRQHGSERRKHVHSPGQFNPSFSAPNESIVYDDEEWSDSELPNALPSRTRKGRSSSGFSGSAVSGSAVLAQERVRAEFLRSMSQTTLDQSPRELLEQRSRSQSSLSGMRSNRSGVRGHVRSASSPRKLGRSGLSSQRTTRSPRRVSQDPNALSPRTTTSPREWAGSEKETSVHTSSRDMRVSILAPDLSDSSKSDSAAEPEPEQPAKAVRTSSITGDSAPDTSASPALTHAATFCASTEAQDFLRALEGV